MDYNNLKKKIVVKNFIVDMILKKAFKNEGDKQMNSDYNINNKVVQANQFIQQTNWTLKETQLKLLKVFISCIDTKHPTGTVNITKKELVQVLGDDYKNHYTYLINQIRSLQTSIKLYEDEKKITYVSLINDFTWYKESEFVTVEFSKKILPYLVDLNERFLQYDVYNIKGFNSKYGLILYEYLLSRERQERDKDHEYFISLNDLKRLTGTMDKYERIDAFERKIVKVAMKDINNANVEFLMKYEKVKTGRNIIGIKFMLRKRTSYIETEFDEIKNKSYSKQKI